MTRARWTGRARCRRETDPDRITAWRALAGSRTRAKAPDVDPDDGLAWCRWTWWPSPADVPGPYEPTIVVHHGGIAGRMFTYDGVFVRDTPMFRTPAFWRRVRPGVLFQLVSYPNGYTGRPTRTKRTRDHERLGTWWPGDPAPDLPMGIGLPPAPVVVVEIEGVGRVMAELAEARPGEAPRYVGRVETRAEVQITAPIEVVNVKAGNRRR